MSTNIFVIEELKTRLDKFLAKQLPQISRSQIQRDIEAGRVQVNGEFITKSKFIVRKGDQVRCRELGIRNQESGVKSQKFPLKILYDGYGLLIIDKPAGLVVHPAAGFKGTTLAAALLHYFKNIRAVGEKDRPGIVHRLDKDTSGVMLVAANQEMYEYLKDAFAERKIQKEYLALVFGHVEKKHGLIDAPMGKSKIDFRKYSTKNMLGPKTALTEYQVLEYLPPSPTPLPLGEGGRRPGEGLRVDPIRGRLAYGTATAALGRPASNGVDGYTLLRIKLHTGRTHQIRVHFSSLGHPVMGDELYGGKKVRLENLERQFLHARRIEVKLPDGLWIEAESELPGDLRTVLKSLNSKTVSQF